ncbi:MAG TPA: hypothetical protein VHP37_28115 [Burkholderiales bacterium]|nr:hypothetical protein [Burkholderiales bacterium]
MADNWTQIKDLLDEIYGVIPNELSALSCTSYRHDRGTGETTVKLEYRMIEPAANAEPADARRGEMALLRHVIADAQAIRAMQNIESEQRKGERRASRS